MKLYTIYIGLNDQHTRRQERPTAEAVSIIEAVLFERVGGATISSARGLYAHADGGKVLEATVRAEIFGAELEAVRAAAAEIRDKLNQESVALTVQEIESYFI